MTGTMSSSNDRPETASQTTEIMLVSGERCRVAGATREVERIILDAARGSIMQLAWLIEAETGDHVAVNPEFVVLVRAARS
jgi:hypothetical protein